MQLAAAVGCKEWKFPAGNSEFKESVRLCKAPESFGKESVSEPPTPSLPPFKEKRATVFKIFQIFLAGGLPWGAQISSLRRH